jgi:hypothetical protein
MVTFDEWLKIGQEAGYCSREICFSHDIGMSDEEIEMFEQGDDPCVWAVRVSSDGTSKETS